MPTEHRPKRIVLYSGGLDSTVLLASLQPGAKALLCSYGQRHVREISAGRMFCILHGIEFNIADLVGIVHLLDKGSQTGNDPVPHGHYAEESMKTTVVPNRNMILLSVAIGWAVATDCNEVYTAVHGGDHAIYPDCRTEFIEMMNHAAQLAGWHRVTVHAPFLHMTKSDIVKLGVQLSVPFGETWSCYEGGAVHCGLCGTCVERKEAFKLAGVEDPTAYAA